MSENDAFPFISLFSGAGGLDLGLEQAGFRSRVAVDIDKWARQTLEDNRQAFGNAELPILDDITRYTPAEILVESGLDPGEAFAVAGGPPCQSFSTAGRRGSIGDPRGSLFRNFADVVAAARPRFFVFENVRGILSAAIKHVPLIERPKWPLEPDEEQGSAFQVILNVLNEEVGYQLVYGLVDAADYGVPQNRLRVVILGSRDREFAFMDLANAVPPTHKGNHRTLRDGLAELAEEPPEFLPYTSERATTMALVPEGKNWRYFRDHPEHGPATAAALMGGAWDADGGRVGFFRRLTWDKPSPTLPTSPIQKSTFLCHPVETRPLSVQEYAAIQQFPATYRFAGSTAQKYKQIGNAVPVGLGRAIGEGLLNVASQGGADGQLRLFESARRESPPVDRYTYERDWSMPNTWRVLDGTGEVGTVVMLHPSSGLRDGAPMCWTYGHPREWCGDPPFFNTRGEAVRAMLRHKAT